MADLVTLALPIQLHPKLAVAWVSGHPQPPEDIFGRPKDAATQGSCCFHHPQYSDGTVPVQRCASHWTCGSRIWSLTPSRSW